MIMAEKIDKMNSGKGTQLFNECMEALFYSDEEIRDTMSPEDADEFIELRDELVSSAKPRTISVGEYSDGDNENDLPMAAEDEEAYGVD